MGSFLTMAGCADEGTRQAPPDDPLASGRVSYEAYCMSCHGAEGKGDGEIAMAGDLAVLPSDLTRLSADNDGVFPLDEVYQTIDGRRVVEGHGSRDMPIWGNIWSDKDGQPVKEEIVQQRINELVEYIRSLQE
ncbi:MAG: c-type cytochrome [Rhodothermales bacterium]